MVTEVVHQYDLVEEMVRGSIHDASGRAKENSECFVPEYDNY